MFHPHRQGLSSYQKILGLMFLFTFRPTCYQPTEVHNAFTSLLFLFKENITDGLCHSAL